jgi:hypothetical protein
LNALQQHLLQVLSTGIIDLLTLIINKKRVGEAVAPVNVREIKKIVGQNTGDDTVRFRCQDIVILYVPDNGSLGSPSKDAATAGHKCGV